MKRLKNYGQNVLSLSKGFTIIETMLFLAITGLLVMAILVGASTSINRQRYRDSIVSLQSFIQNQYSEVMNVQNSRDDKWQCEDGSVTQLTSGSGVSRGQTDCVILGKLIVNTDNNSLKVNRVIGSIPLPDNTTTLNDTDIFKKEVDSIKGYNASISNSDEQTYDIEWSASMMNPGGEDFDFSIMILRSPNTGLIRTFIDKTEAIATSAKIQQKLSNNNLSSANNLKICVNPTGMFSGSPNAIQIAAGTVNASGVESLGDGSSECANHT